MKKPKKIVTSVTIHPEMKKKADELHINYSEAFEKGLEMMFTLNDDEYEKKQVIEKQRKKVMELKSQMKFGEELSAAINEIKSEYSEIMDSSEDIEDNEYMRELIKLKAMELDIPDNALMHLFKNMIMGKTTDSQIEQFKKGDIDLVI